MNINDMKNELLLEISKIIDIVKQEYPELANTPEGELEDRVHIEDTGTISLFVKDGHFYFPLSANAVLNELKKNPLFGSDPNHKTCNEDNMIINNNTFEDFINHIVLKGMTPLDYYKEIVLHETLHYCGSGGGSAIREGINELKTRQLAKKYGLQTSSCGYPKETKIASELEGIFGKEIVDKISFAKKNSEIRGLLDTVAPDAYTFYSSLEQTMEVEFYHKYMKHKFPGPNGHIEKTKKYNSIDYSNAYDLINDYKNRHNIATKKEESKPFDQRSEMEISIAKDIRKKNQMIAAKKQKEKQQNQMDKPKQLVKTNDGYVNFISLAMIIIITSIVFIVMKFN